MRVSNLLFSAIHLLVVFFIMCVGAVLVFLPLSPKLLFAVTMSLIDRPDAYGKVGLGVLGSSVVLFFGFYMLNRRRFIQYKMKGFSIDPKVAEGYVRDYWHGLFPGNDVEVVVRKPRQLEVIAQMPTVEEELLERIEKELGSIFSSKLGYNDSFILTVH